ncbi:MAG: NADH-quinone oxidoreductase subunit M [Planctomycetes bacterium]|nr:NADH-quinone oxidoreductase subunit M [Planctomycetota bacterium]
MMSVLLLVIPLLGAVVVALAPTRRARWIALATSGVVFLVSIGLAFQFEHWSDGGFSAPVGMPWLEVIGVDLQLRADAVSMVLVLLTTLIMPLCVAGSFTAITHRIKEYYAWLLVIQTAMTGVFLARDLIFFYICFEFTLVPMFFLIAIYGGSERSRASIKFFLFTFTGSMITLAGLLYVAWQYAMAKGVDGQLAWSFDIEQLTVFTATGLNPGQQAWILLALMAGFAVKVPLFPVHTWLPLAHTEAPTAGSVILAAILLKLGTYGLYRFVLPMVPDAVIEYAPFIATLSIIGILYAALVCWVQTDVKKLVAYSSVSHLGFCVLGLFALNPMGLQGSVLYMINHGLSTGALFFLVGMMYERYHTRDMRAVSGLAQKMPVWSFFMVFFVLSSVGLPGLNGFVSEFLCLIAAFTATATVDTQTEGLLEIYPGVLGPWYAAFAALGMIFAAMYLLIMVGRIVFGPLKEPNDHADDAEHAAPALPADLTWREITVLVPLAVLCVVIGFKPGIVTDAIEQPIESVLAEYPRKVSRLTRTAEAPAEDPALRLAVAGGEVAGGR